MNEQKNPVLRVVTIFAMVLAIIMAGGFGITITQFMMTDAGYTIPGATAYLEGLGYAVAAPGTDFSLTDYDSLTAGNANAICFAWHNPEAYDILIEVIEIEVTTAGGTPGSHLDIGIADDAIGTNRGLEFFDDLPLNTTGVYHSFTGGDGGQQTSWVVCQDIVSVTDGWIVGQILDANAANLVGTYHIVYTRRN